MGQKRIYLDYNSTSPLDKNVIEFLSKGDFFYANPSSQHQMGKETLKQIRNTSHYIFDFFSINRSDEFKIFYHSGATEGLNTFVKSLDLETVFYFMPTDHSCVIELAKEFELRGGKSTKIPLLKSGHVDISKLKEMVNCNSSKKAFNFTWVNNETGVVQELADLDFLKEDENNIIHIDAAQAIGKANNYRVIPKFLDMITFSGHKFGAIKGCGFTILKSKLKVKPFIIGGGQQDRLRSGTYNTEGILSIAQALKSFESYEDSKAILKMKNDIIQILKDLDEFDYIENESFNTICVLHKEKKSDEMLIHFDMNGIAVSSGSACSSGSLKPSHVLLAMGFSDKANQSIRISLGRRCLEDKDMILQRLRDTLKEIR